jgi:outer membrane protein insertion porin family
MEKRLLGGLAFVVLMGLAAFSAFAVEYPIDVTAISVQGNVEIRTKQILDVVPFHVGDSISESDLKAASQAIYDLDWFSEVAPSVGSDGSIVFKVVENPVIQEIVIQGNINEKTYSLFGVPLYSTKIMPTWKIKQILRDDGIKKGEVLKLKALQTALQDVLDEYQNRGYVLVMVGNVKPESTLVIQFVEGRVVGNVIKGLTTVPESVAQDMIDLPLGEPVKQADIQTIVGRFRQSVYFQGVDVTPIEGTDSDTVQLQWTLTERTLIDQPISFDRVELLGVTEFPMDVAQRSLGDVPTGPADNYQLLRMVQGLFDLYYRSGYIMVRFAVDRVEDGTLYLRVDEGIVSQVSFGVGTQTQQRVMRKNLEVYVGRVLTLNDLRVSYQKLNGLGYFKSVTIDPQWADDGVHVTVSVTDRSDLGGMNGSLAFEPNTGGLVGELSISQRNLFGTGQDVSLSYQRGITPEGEPESSTWSLEYSSVALASAFDTVGFKVYRKTKDVTTDDEDSTYVTLGGSVSFAYPVADYTDLTVGYRHEIGKAEDETSWTPVDSVSLALGLDTTDDMYFPMRGEHRTASIEQAGGFAPGDEYTKLDLSWIQFSPVYLDWFGTMKDTFGIRFKLGLGSQSLPATDAYEFGGPASIRGAESQTVDRMFLANFENRLQLIEGLVLTTFFDWGVNLDSLRPEDVLSSTGLELGITAAGVFVRLDIVWMLNAEASWVPRFDIGFGPMF